MIASCAFRYLPLRTKQADTKAFAKLLRVVGTALMAKHGQAIADKGLDAVELGSCAKVSRLWRNWLRQSSDWLGMLERKDR